MPELNDSPDLSTDDDIIDEESLKPRRAIKDGKQAFSVAESLEKQNSERNKTNELIRNKYNGGQPYSPSALSAAGETWRNNFPTGFMSGIIDRVVPAASQIIDAVRYVTSATLRSKEDKDTQKKTEAFREVVTRFWRQWDGAKDCVYSTSQENSLVGGVAWGWLDEDDPFPSVFRQNQFFLPDGTSQHAKSVPVVRFNKTYLIHEAIEFIKDGRDIADKAGHDVDAWVETINAARAKETEHSSGSMDYEDMVREGNMGMSYEGGAKVVETIHLLVSEPDTSKVTHYMMDGRGDHKVLYQKDDRYEKMEDCLTLFTLQPGDGKFYGSKGLGKLLINLHLAIERLRNLIVDNVSFAGRMIIKSDPMKQLNFQMRTNGPFMLVGAEGEFQEKQIQANVQDYLRLDEYMRGLAEAAAGSYISDPVPTDSDGETATAKKIDYAREQQAKNASIGRFMGQFGNGISTFQKRLCNKSSSHQACKDALEALKEAGLTPGDIKELVNTPAAEVVQDMTQLQNGQVSAVADRYRGNPMVDQVELTKRDITAISTPQLADDLILPDAVDPAVITEQTRQQVLENVALNSGEKAVNIPVSPRDNPQIHLQTTEKQMMEDWPMIVQKAQSGDPDIPQILDNLNQGILHAEQHLEVWKQTGGKPEEIKPYQDKIEEADKAIVELAKGYAQLIAQKQSEQPQGGEMIPPEAQGMAPPEQALVEPPVPQEQPKPLDVNNLFKVYSETPDDIKRQIEAAWGFHPSQIGAIGNSTLTGPQADEVDETLAQPPQPEEQYAIPTELPIQ